MLYGRIMWDEWEMKQVVVLLSQWIETQEDEDSVKNSIESLYKLAMQKEWILPKFRECLVKTTEHENPGISSLANEILHRT